MTAADQWAARSDELSGQRFAASADAPRGSVRREDAAAFEAALRGGDGDGGSEAPGALPDRPVRGGAGRPQSAAAPEHDVESGGIRRAEGDAAPAETSGPRPQGRNSVVSGQPEASGQAAALEALFRGVSMPLDAAPSAAGAEQARGPNLSGLPPETIERLVSRILVGAPEGGSTEVRLIIQDDVLRDTEIWLSRDASGSLSVRMTTKDEGAYRMLAASCASLDETLSRAEASPVRVDVVLEEGDSGTDRRSRGLDQLERDEDDEGT